MGKDGDMTITCRQCGKDFVFTRSEDEFYKMKGFILPHRCKECRLTRQQKQALVNNCSKCGNDVGETATYCATCMVDVQFESELKYKMLECTLNEANAKIAAFESEKSHITDEVCAHLREVEAEKAQIVAEYTEKMNAVESQKAQLTESLRQKEQQLAELKTQLNGANSELEKAAKYRVQLEGLEPALTGMKQKLEALETAQSSLDRDVRKLTEDLHSERSGGLKGLLRKLFGKA